MTLAAPQLELNFALGHSRAWLRVSEVARALDVSEDHVCNLFDDAKIDFVIDIKARGADRPYYRILREAWENYDARRRFGGGEIVPHPSYELSIANHLRKLPMVLGAEACARFFSISENHVRALSDHFSDVGAAGQKYFRANKNQLLTFIQNRKL